MTTEVVKLASIKTILAFYLLFLENNELYKLHYLPFSFSCVLIMYIPRRRFESPVKRIRTNVWRLNCDSNCYYPQTG